MTLTAQLLAWRKVIFALLLRELQSKYNDKLGLGWAFIQPFAFIFILSVIRAFISGSEAHGVPVVIFMMIGMLGIQSFLVTINTVSGAIKKNRPLYAFRQVQPIASIITSGFLEFAIKSGVIFMLAISLYFMELTFPISDPLLLLLLYVGLWIFSISVSLLFSVAAAFVPEIDKIKAMLTRPLFFISCVFFSLQDVPEKYWGWINWNPIVHYIELARYACYEEYGHRGVSVEYAMMSALIALFFSLAVYHITWKKVLSR